MSVARPASHSGMRLLRLFWLTVLTAHAMAAVAWYWLEPGGFPWGHPRAWVNRPFPIAGFAWCAICLAALRRADDARLSGLLPAYPAAWATGGATARVAFPITFSVLWLVPMALALVMTLALIPFRRGAAARNGRLIAVATAWAMIGCLAVLSQRPARPGTHPLGLGLSDPSGSRDTQGPVPGIVRLGPHTAVYPSEGSISTQLSGLTLNVQPLLRFLSGSPDGCWVVFNRAAEREGSQPRLGRRWEAREGGCTLNYEFPALGRAVLVAAVDASTRAIRLDAAAAIDRPVYSHLNAFCDIEVRGHRRLFLSFSPCPETRIEVLSADYPVGRPIRFAFVDERRRFIVAEASSGEKGPFHTLAEGTLEPAEPLTIILHDEDREAVRIRLDDWSAQLATQLSPTAGWRVPVNAIEFSLAGASPASPASIFITLAGTSVGRGWDCVGHEAGTYRNRIAIDRVSDGGSSRVPFPDGRDLRTELARAVGDDLTAEPVEDEEDHHGADEVGKHQYRQGEKPEPLIVTMPLGKTHHPHADRHDHNDHESDDQHRQQEGPCLVHALADPDAHPGTKRRDQPRGGEARRDDEAGQAEEHRGEEPRRRFFRVLHEGQEGDRRKH